MISTIDAGTLAVCYGITSVLQCIALFLQYRTCPSENGLGWWTVGSVCLAVGFIINLFRGIDLIHNYVAIVYNFSFVAGFLCIYSGLEIFGNRKVNISAIIALAFTSLLMLLLFTFIEYSIPGRRMTTSTACALISLLSANAIRKYVSQSKTSRMLTGIFLFNAAALVTLSILPLAVGRGLAQDSKAIFLIATYFIIITTSTLWTFCLIILVNNKLSEQINAARLFLESTLDGLSAHIAIIDATGNIVLVNKAWREFACCNGADPERVSLGINYINVCTSGPLDATNESTAFAEGIKSVLEGTSTLFKMEYACHSINAQRWFLGRVTPFPGSGPKRAVIAHEDITERKLMEMALMDSNRKLEMLTNEDGLTNISNRRHFDTVLSAECSRHARTGSPLSLLILDIDYFKMFNDTYGHVLGDECLRSIARVLADCCKRPADLAARYGGEEFACLLPDTNLIGAISVAENIRKHIETLSIPHGSSLASDIVTASIGLVTIQCDEGTTPSDIIRQADELLYQAKNEGRNRVKFRGINDEIYTQSLEDNATTLKISLSKSHLSGNASIDSQHANLISLANDLLRSMFTENDLADLKKHMTIVLKHVEEHFIDEERILSDAKYPSTAEHASEHRRLVLQCSQMISEHSEVPALQTDIIQYVINDIIMQHMIHEDMKYNAHLRSHPDIRA